MSVSVVKGASAAEAAAAPAPARTAASQRPNMPDVVLAPHSGAREAVNPKDMYMRVSKDISSLSREADELSSEMQALANELDTDLEEQTADKISKKWKEFTALLPKVTTLEHSVNLFHSKARNQPYLRHPSFKKRLETLDSRLSEINKPQSEILRTLFKHNLALGEGQALLQIKTDPSKTPEQKDVAKHVAHFAKKALIEYPVASAFYSAVGGYSIDSAANLIRKGYGEKLFSLLPTSLDPSEYYTLDTAPYFPALAVLAFAATTGAIWVGVPKARKEQCYDLINSSAQKVTDAYQKGKEWLRPSKKAPIKENEGEGAASDDEPVAQSSLAMRTLKTLAPGVIFMTAAYYFPTAARWAIKEGIQAAGLNSTLSV